MPTDLLQAPPWVFRLPLPPQGSNHGYRLVLRGRHPGLAKTPELLDWEAKARLALEGWRPPSQTALAVEIRLEVPRELRRRLDVDSCVKFLVDLVVGSRRDHWVDELRVRKVLAQGEGQAVVLVEPYEAGSEEGEREQLAPAD